MGITDEQYCKLTGRGGIIKLIDEDNFKPEVCCKAIYQDAPEIDLEIMIIGNQSKDNRFILVGVKDNYRADYPEPIFCFIFVLHPYFCNDSKNTLISSLVFRFFTPVE